MAELSEDAKKKIHETKATTERQDQRRGHISWDLRHHTGCSLEGLEPFQSVCSNGTAIEMRIKAKIQIKIKHRYTFLWWIKNNRRFVGDHGILRVTTMMGPQSVIKTRASVHIHQK